MVFHIEFDIPMPEVGTRFRAKKYPFSTMPIGASFALDDSIKNPATIAARARFQYKPKIFVGAPDPERNGEGWRIWRTA